MKKIAKKTGQSFLIAIITIVVWVVVVVSTGLYEALMLKPLILLVGIVLIIRLWFVGWDSAGSGPMAAFQRGHTDLQKAAILQSLFEMGGADGKFSAAEEAYLFQTAKLLGYDLIKNRNKVINLGAVGHGARVSLTNSQKHWLLVTLMEMANIDNSGREQKQAFFEQLIASLGISGKEATAVLEKSHNVMKVFNSLR